MTRPHTLDTTKRSECSAGSRKHGSCSNVPISLAIARVFGGFPRTFFTTYHENHPKSEPVDQYELRGDLYELFHYLNHTLLFGVGLRVYVGVHSIECFSIQGLLRFQCHGEDGQTFEGGVVEMPRVVDEIRDPNVYSSMYALWLTR